MLAGLELEQKIKGLGFRELNAKLRREFGASLAQRSKLFANTDPKSWASVFQARGTDSQVCIASYQQESVVDVKSLTKYQLMNRGLMKNSFTVRDNYLIGVLFHPALDGISGQLKKRSFLKRLLLRRPEWHFVPAPGREWPPATATPKASDLPPAADQRQSSAVLAILEFLNRIPIRESEVADGIFCFTHQHVEQHADIPKLATALAHLLHF